MPTNTPLIGVPIPTLSEAANVPQDMNNAAVHIEKYTVIPCLSSARPGSPHEGMTIYETNTDIYRVWNGSAWARAEHFRHLSGNTALVGGSAPASTGTTEVLMHAGTVVGTLSIFQAFNFTFPSAFPTGLITFVATLGDNVNADGHIFTQSPSKSGITIGIKMPGATGLVRVNYIALGW